MRLNLYALGAGPLPRGGQVYAGFALPFNAGCCFSASAAPSPFHALPPHPHATINLRQVGQGGGYQPCTTRTLWRSFPRTEDQRGNGATSTTVPGGSRRRLFPAFSRQT